MQREPVPLMELVRQAQAEADGVAEVARQLQICNACRYCEGFCAVFPAMTRRLAFEPADAHYLANLCHNCGACLHACQYAPPHEFAVNLPRAMAQVRGSTYQHFAWPQPLGAARTGSLWGSVAAGNFYAIFPHGLMVSLFAPVFAFALLALGVGVARFWRTVSPGDAALSSAPAVGEAVHDALRLKYLDGGHGQGCHNEDDAWTLSRRRMHHLTFYGFALCFASTSVATLYHYALGWPAPYGWTSLPKLLGMTGGLMLVAGTAGLWRLRRRRHAAHVEPTQAAMDLGFIALLFLTGATGLLLALLKTTPALPLLLCTHLGAVMALFLTLPYGKFAHGVYRAAALLKWSVERRQPLALSIGE